MTGKLAKGETEVPELKAIDEKTVEFQAEREVDPNLVKGLFGTKAMAAEDLAGGHAGAHHLP
jgi:hypothetical protein